MTTKKNKIKVELTNGKVEYVEVSELKAYLEANAVEVKKYRRELHF